MRQLVRSISGDNLVFYFSFIWWLRLQQETNWVNNNFEKSYHDNFGKILTLNLIEQNITHFSFISLTQKFLLRPWKTYI